MFFKFIIGFETFFCNVVPRDFEIFVFDIFLQRMFQGDGFADGDDFVGEFFLVPKIILEGGTKDFCDAGLFGQDENVAMVGGFERGQAERLGD